MTLLESSMEMPEFWTVSPPVPFHLVMALSVEEPGPVIPPPVGSSQLRFALPSVLRYWLALPSAAGSVQTLLAVRDGALKPT